jgi:RNA polymerase sigma-70 factor (ECF subfamily)
MIHCDTRSSSGGVPYAVRIWRQRADVEDGALLSAVARGDREAYAAFYHRHSPTVLGLLCRILRSRPEAEDVLQEVFLQVWRQARQFDLTRGAPFVWLTMLARSRAFDRLESIASRQRTVARAAGAPVDLAPDPADLAVSAEDEGRLRRALARVPDEQREVLLLAYFEGLSQSAIAARLALPLGTVKSNARLGLEKLRRQFRSRRHGAER